MFDYLALFQEYLTVELGLAKNTQLAYMRDLRLLMKSLQLKQMRSCCRFRDSS